MASLTGKKIKDSYDSLLKVSDNETLSNVKKKITDGFGIESGLSLDDQGNAGIESNLEVGGDLSVGGVLDVNGVNNSGALYDSNGSVGTPNQVLTSTGIGTDWVSLDLEFATDAELQAEATARANADNILQNNILVEEDVRFQSDVLLQDNIDTEAVLRASADVSLQSNIDTEATQRSQADATLQANLDAEQSARVSADNSLQLNIDAEVSARTSADSTLSSAISGETTARESADNVLQSNINAEATARANADTTLTNNLNTEVANRLSADLTLQAQITSNDTDIANEVANRISADNTLQSNINAEATTRLNADAVLEASILAEGLTRQTADANLQSQITSNDSDIAGLEANKVPYTGATGDVDLGANALRTQLLQLTGGTGTQGEMYWNPDEETIDVVMNGAVLQMGQEVYVHVRNNTGSTIQNGMPCYVTGSLGASGRLTIAPMIANGTIDPKYFIGVATEDIEAGGDGKLTWFGKVRHFDTSDFPEGSSLFVSTTTAGGWQTTKPYAPLPDIEVAFTINSTNNGTIFVRGDVAKNLNHLYDVDVAGAVGGEVLQYFNGVWGASNGLTDETANRISADNALQGDIDTLQSGLSQEVSDRESADIQLQNNIDAEASARASADTILQANIDAEESARITEDANLQAQITSNDNDIADLYATKEDKANKGVANGYASLDANGLVPTSQLPESVTGALEFIGLWDASTNTPTLPDPTTHKGEYYKVSVEGTYLGVLFHVGDWALSDGIAWEHIHTQESVSDVFGRTGSVTAIEADYSAFYPLISDLTQEVTDRTNADTALQGQITTNANDIDTLETATGANATAISLVQAELNTETSARISADSVLQANIDAEESARISADSVLQGQITTNAGNISANSTAIGVNATNITNNTNAIQAEAITRGNADANLQSQIDVVEDNLADEVIARAQGDTLLNNAIEAEETARISADNAIIVSLNAEIDTRITNDNNLTNSLTTEVTNRVTGDANLQTQIDGIQPIIDSLNLQSVTDVGNTTTNSIEAASFVKTGGTSGQFLKADGSVDNTAYIPVGGAPAPNNATITLSAGSGMTGGGDFTTDQSVNETITISHADTSSQGSVDNSGRTFIQDITLDTYGHITGIVSATDSDTFTGTVTSVATGGGLTGGTITGSGTISHADTSAQASVDNSNGVVIQDVTLDTYGHITSLGSVDLDNRYYTETEADDKFTYLAGSGIEITTPNVITNTLPDTGIPAILSNGTTPSLNTGITAEEVRTLINAAEAGGGGGGGVTSLTAGAGIIIDNSTGDINISALGYQGAGSIYPYVYNDATGQISNGSGQWSLIGDIVFYKISFTVTADFASPGPSKIGGLPFIVGGSYQSPQHPMFYGGSLCTTRAGSEPRYLHPVIGTDYIQFNANSRETTPTYLRVINGDITATGWYFIS